MSDITLDQFRDRLRESQVKCEVCGWKGHSVVAHLREAHDMSPGQYQKEFPREQYSGAKLASPIVAEMLRHLGRVPTEKGTSLTTVMVALDLAESELDEIFAQMGGKLPKVVEKNLTDDAIRPKKDENFVFPEQETRQVVAGLLLGKNVFISGPTGCGKTELAFQIHSRINRPLYRVNMQGDATYGTFIGAMRADPQKGTWFKYGVAPHAARAGTTLLIDEIDYTPPQVAATMNPLLEARRIVHIEDTDETVKAEEGFTVIATANTGGKGDPMGVYTGTEMLNTAMLDRFAVKVELGYLDEASEVSMLGRRFPGADGDLVITLVKGAKEVRTAFMQGNLVNTMSTRKLIDFFELLPLLGETSAIEATMLNWLEEDDRQLVVDLFRRVGIKTKR